MLQVQTSDGRIARVNLRDEKQAQAFLRQLKSSEYQSGLRALTILQYTEVRCGHCGGRTTRGFQHTVARPDGFSDVFFHAENIRPDLENRVRGGERLVCFAGDVRLTLMAHVENPAVYISLRRMGKQRYNPLAE